MTELEKLWQEYVDRAFTQEQLQAIPDKLLLDLKKAFVFGIHQTINLSCQKDTAIEAVEVLKTLLKEEEEFWDNPIL